MFIIVFNGSELRTFFHGIYIYVIGTKNLGVLTHINIAVQEKVAVWPCSMTYKN